MKNRKLLISLGIVVLVAIVAIAIFKNRQPKANDKVIRIGAILPLTGSMSFLGEPELLGVQAAVEKYNESQEGQKHPMQLIIEDSKGDVKSSVMAAQKLVNSKITAVITSCSGVSKAVAPIFNKADIPMFALCSDTSIATENKNCINFYVNLGAEQDALVGYLKKQGVKELSVLRINAEAGILAINLLRQKYPELSITDEWEYDLDRRDFRDIAVSIKHSLSKNLYIVGVGIRFSVILEALKHYEVDKSLFGNYMFLSASTLTAPQDILSRVSFTAFPITVDKLQNTELGIFFEKKGKKMPVFMDYVFAYDAIRFIGLQYNKDTKAMAFLKNSRNTTFESTFGEMVIQEDGNAYIPMRVGHYLTNGHVELIDDKF